MDAFFVKHCFIVLCPLISEAYVGEPVVVALA